MEVELRVVLLIVGLIILLVVGIDLFRRKTSMQNAVKIATQQREEYLSQPFFDPVVEETLTSAPNYNDQHEPLLQDEIPDSLDYSKVENLKPIPNNIISITLRARSPYGFKGSSLIDALHKANLHFGKNNIFYRYFDDSGTGEVLFSAVKAVEPGYFSMETLSNEYIPGITLILLPEQVENPYMALDKLVRTAKQMAFSLNAELLDHDRKALTLETIERYHKQATQK